MNAQKKPPQRGGEKRIGKWCRRGLLAALVLAAGALLWEGLPKRAEAPAPSPTPMRSASPAPPQAEERTAREAAYDKDMAALKELMANEALGEDVRSQAAERVSQMAADHQTELGIEEALTQAGFAPCMALMQNGALTIVLGEIDAAQSAAVLSLCAAHTDIAVENIRIMTFKAR